MLHPSTLSFYFFHAGIGRQSPWKILFVPLVMVPYGLTLALILYSFRSSLQKAVESPFIMITAIFIWLVLAIFIQQRKNKTEELKTKMENHKD